MMKQARALRAGRAACLLACLSGLMLSGAAWAAQPPTKPSDRESRLASRHEAKLYEEIADLYRAADTTYMVGDLTRAADMFAKIVGMAPSSPYMVRTYARLGDCYYEMKRWAEAAQQYRRAAAAATNVNNGEEQVAGIRADFMVGQAFVQAKLHTQAFSQFRRFIDRHPGHPLVNLAYQSIGDAHLAMEQYQQALTAYRMVGTVINQKTAAHHRITPGKRLYLRVTDADVNVGDTPRSVTATLRTTAGDLEIVELEPLGVRSPVFIATIPTMLGVPRQSAKLKQVFTENTATRIRSQLAESEKLDLQARKASEDAHELDRSPEKTANPAGVEKRRSALMAEAEQTAARSNSLRAEACKTIDQAFAAYEKILAEWAPEQSLAAIAARRSTTQPATQPGVAVAGFSLQASAIKPLGGADDDAPTAPVADATARGMSEQQLADLRLGVSKVPTSIENVDGRLTALSVWSRLLFRQFQRLELMGNDRIEIEYFDEIGPNGPNKGAAAIRKDVLQVASDANIDLLTKDGQESLSQVIVNADLLLRVEDLDQDISDQRDSVVVTLAAMQMTDERAAEVHAVSRGETPPAATQRATPGEVTEANGPAEQKQPLAPPNCNSIQVRLTETGTHTGVFEASVHLGDSDLSAAGTSKLPIRDPESKRLMAIRMAYADAKAVRRPDGWVLAKTVDCYGTGSGDVAAVQYRQTRLDLEAKLKRAVAAGELGKIYLELGLAQRGRSYLASAQADCTEVAKLADKTALGEEALYRVWRVYFYAGLMDEAVHACRDLMTRYPSSQYIDEAMFAMGEASLAAGKKAIEATIAAGEKVSMNKELARAVGQLDELLKRFPKSPRAPEALYLIGEARIAAGGTGLDVFERLAKAYPDSVFAARGLLTSARYYFDLGDHKRGLEYYSRVLLDYPDSPDLGEALLKRGICHYKLGQNTEALQSFYRVAEEYGGTPLSTEAQKYINFINQKRGGKDE